MNAVKKGVSRASARLLAILNRSRHNLAGPERSGWGAPRNSADRSQVGAVETFEARQTVQSD